MSWTARRRERCQLANYANQIYAGPNDIDDINNVSIDSDNNKWVPVVNYDIKKTATGTGDLLVLDYDLPAGYALWVRYAKQHDRMDSADDELDEAIHPDRVVYGAAAELLRWYRDKTRLRHLSDTIEHLDAKAQRARDLHPLPQLPSRQAKVMRFNRTFVMGQ